MVSTLPLTLMKLLGRKVRSDPPISIRLRKAMTVSIKPSWKRSTMSAEWDHEPASRPNSSRRVERTCASDLEQVLLLELFEDGFEAVSRVSVMAWMARAGKGVLTALDLGELIRDEQGEESVIVRVDGNVERDELIQQDERVQN